jgi:hypothetical protein
MIETERKRETDEAQKKKKNSDGNIYTKSRMRQEMQNLLDVLLRSEVPHVIRETMVHMRVKRHIVHIVKRSSTLQLKTVRL